MSRDRHTGSRQLRAGATGDPERQPRLTCIEKQKKKKKKTAYMLTGACVLAAGAVGRGSPDKDPREERGGLFISNRTKPCARERTTRGIFAG